MAAANLDGLIHPDEIGLAWSRFLIDDIVDQREAKTRPLLAAIFTFQIEDGIPALPTLPHLFLPEDLEAAKRITRRDPETYAYLVMLPGLPVPKAKWTQEPSAAKGEQLLGMPQEIIEEGTFPWYLMALYTSPTVKMSFCGAFDGEKFTKINCIHGSYGGSLSDLLGSDA
jgi:hypothetical protein